MLKGILGWNLKKEKGFDFKINCVGLSRWCFTKERMDSTDSTWLRGYVLQVVVEPYYYHFAGDAALSLSNNLIVIPRYRLISHNSAHFTHTLYISYWLCDLYIHICTQESADRGMLGIIKGVTSLISDW